MRTEMNEYNADLEKYILADRLNAHLAEHALYEEGYAEYFRELIWILQD
jgi:hypothetical protein